MTKKDLSTMDGPSPWTRPGGGILTLPPTPMGLFGRGGPP